MATRTLEKPRILESYSRSRFQLITPSASPAPQLQAAAHIHLQLDHLELSWSPQPAIRRLRLVKAATTFPAALSFSITAMERARSAEPRTPGQQGRTR